VAAGRTALPSDPATAADLLRRGLALWRGDVLSDVGLTNDFVPPVAARLTELRLVAWELWVKAGLALGDPGVLEALEPLVVQNPLREHLTALLMLTLYRAGPQADASAAYRRLRDALDTELGIRPSPEVETLHQQVLRQDASLTSPWPAADLRSDSRRPTGAMSSTTSAGAVATSRAHLAARVVRRPGRRAGPSWKSRRPCRRTLCLGRRGKCPVGLGGRCRCADPN